MRSRVGWSDEALLAASVACADFMRGPGGRLIEQELAERREKYDKYIEDLEPENYCDHKTMYNAGARAGMNEFKKTLNDIEKIGKEANARLSKP